FSQPDKRIGAEGIEDAVRSFGYGRRGRCKCLRTQDQRRHQNPGGSIRCVHHFAPTTATRSMLVVPVTLSGTPPVITTCSPLVAKPSLSAKAVARSTISSRLS